MRILAFDLGRTTGWATLDSGELRTASYEASDEGKGVYVEVGYPLRSLSHYRLGLPPRISW